MSDCIDSDPRRFSAAPDHISIDDNALRVNKVELQVLNGIVEYLDVPARFYPTTKIKRVSVRFAPGLLGAVNERIVFDPDTRHRVEHQTPVGHDAVCVKSQVGNHEITGYFDCGYPRGASLLPYYRISPFADKR